MPILHGESIGRDGLLANTPSSAPAVMGAGLVVASGSGSNYDLGWTLRAVLQQPAANSPSLESLLGDIGSNQLGWLNLLTMLVNLANNWPNQAPSSGFWVDAQGYIRFVPGSPSGSGIGAMVIGSSFVIGSDAGIGSMAIGSTFQIG